MATLCKISEDLWVVPSDVSAVRVELNEVVVILKNREVLRWHFSTCKDADIFIEKIVSRVNNWLPTTFHTTRL